MSDSCLLVQYTIRSKQNYIFRTNKLLEIVGASKIISETFDVLVSCAENAIKKIGDKNKEENKPTEFMYELFRGGGNDTFLVSSIDTLRKINKLYSYKLLNEYPGLIPMVVYVPVTGNYSADYEALMKEATRKKNLMVPQYLFDALPFSQRKRENLQVINRELYIEKENIQYSNESYAKWKKGKEGRDDNIKFFDGQITKKGEESLLAIVHADGNNMGKKIKELTKNKICYKECVELMRQFTDDTQKAFKDTSKVLGEEVKRIIAENPGIDEKKVAYRLIVNDGDDLTFICNARWALRLTRTYLKAVQEYKGNKITYGEESKDFRYSSCAGICIFHSHYPWSVAYSLAEQACESAKETVHLSQEEEGYIDFHYIHAGVGGNLKEIREKLGISAISNRPYGICGDKESYSIDYLDNLAKAINGKDGDDAKLARSNLKKIGTLMEESEKLAENEWNRICYQNPKFKNYEARYKPEGVKDEDLKNNLLKTVYDLSEIYDLWYTDLKGGDQDAED